MTLSAAEKDALLREYEEVSPWMPLVHFCSERGLSERTFRSWRRAAREPADTLEVHRAQEAIADALRQVLAAQQALRAAADALAQGAGVHHELPAAAVDTGAAGEGDASDQLGGNDVEDFNGWLLALRQAVATGADLVAPQGGEPAAGMPSAAAGAGEVAAVCSHAVPTEYTEGLQQSQVLDPPARRKRGILIAEYE